MNLVTASSIEDPELAQLLYRLIAQRGLVGSKRLQALTGKSQASVARALAALGARVIKLGKARRTLYAVPKEILGFSGEQPIYVTLPSGQSELWGRLCFLEGKRIYVERGGWSATSEDEFPWFLEPLRLQGFLGKLRGQSLGFADANPEHWSLDQMLFAILAHEHDNMGAFSLGAPAPKADAQIKANAVALAPTRLTKRGAYYDLLAQDMSRLISAGSSAGGEQPKFLTDTAGESLIVKFTPPRGTPFGERWHDLLHAEAMALYVLSQHGMAVAQPRIVQTTQRTYLESVRFDRIGLTGTVGKRHVVSLTSVHAAFVNTARQHWPATCAALHAQGRLSQTDLLAVQTIYAFGHLIGNTDMHFGNLSLLVEDLNRLDNPTFTLAPVYDMLPMRYRPSEFRDELGYSTFTPPELVGIESQARDKAIVMARDFWQAMHQHEPVSLDFRRLAKVQADRCA